MIERLAKVLIDAGMPAADAARAAEVLDRGGSVRDATDALTGRCTCTSSRTCAGCLLRDGKL